MKSVFRASKMLASKIRAALVAGGNQSTAIAKATYFKNVCQFHGLKAPELQQVLDSFKDDVKGLQLQDAFRLASDFISSLYHEEKLTAVTLLKLHLKHLDSSHLPVLEDFFLKNHVYDWATCDTLCGTLIHDIIKRHPADATRTLLRWKDSENIWQKRASCVSFVKLARHGQFNETIFDICRTTVQHPERFVQLGTGWVLRELSLADRPAVVAFIERHYDNFSREGLRYAIEKMDKSLQSRLLKFVPAASASDANSDARTPKPAAAPDSTTPDSDVPSRSRARASKRTADAAKPAAAAPTKRARK
eukprot:TRINITY_DN7811_c0_g1_i3.p1 TRINITY_DN7811_c0_g1~~TRINITY_DN7811_c0_g1_i3.p1  ORF type:complete len:305 (-),score=48.90 TRINITY_DN7811_c0_g1_i3:266-1180(-)